MSIYPDTELVILAGGQARRMQGKNKLLQQFDQEIQLLKIYRRFCDEVSKIWVNSHRDCAVYQKLIPEIGCFLDDEAGFLGPLMGMKSAWSYASTQFILFVPCDITFIPERVLFTMHHTLSMVVHAQAVFVSINGQHLYPFCLLKRGSLETMKKHLEKNQFSLQQCLAALQPKIVHYENPIRFHSINSDAELKQYREALLMLNCAQSSELN